MIKNVRTPSLPKDKTTSIHESNDTNEVVSATRNDYEIDNNSQGLSLLCHSIYCHQHKYDMLWHFSLGAMMLTMCSSPEHQIIWGGLSCYQHNRSFLTPEQL